MQKAHSHVDNDICNKYDKGVKSDSMKSYYKLVRK